ncbi:MDIS1-interacting receptor like kinase 2-like [Phoenix dactylifera]|uniref:non-specific serine/threonine protein kinase n=1 Tax=Phoenix dactylifera TaxID=42345 RepID=A0A8B7BKK3_PHODC|nr:MDIS1-interacting receptor like kinase 2-like [Phoenix dactylifera]
MDPSRRQIQYQSLPLNHLSISLLLLSFFLLHHSSATTVAATPASSIVESQARVLLHWKSTLQNSHAQQLGSWSLSNNMCMWHGITCMENGGRAVITGISLPRAGLVGKLDALNFSALPSLTRLHLRRNYLFGTISPSICTLPALTSLDLSQNRLSGNLPLALASLSNLTEIDLSSNKFIGEMPPEIGQLKSLRVLYLYRNNLAGPIPSTLGNLTNLRFLELHRNQFSGDIPRELGNLVNLLDLAISYNYLTGSIPSSLGNLIRLKTLYLGINNLSGTIPHELGNLVNLRDLDIIENQLSGSIPSTLGNLTMLDTLYLHTNHLSGSLPQELGNHTSLISLEVYNNNFSGYLPSEICKGGALQYLIVQNNYFEGPIPRSLKNCSSLFRVRLEGNKLKGNISEDFGIYPNLHYIDMSYNQLYGEISPSWAHCQNLTRFSISGNLLTGNIPPEFEKLLQLEVLDLSSNQLAGEIPRELGTMSLLFHLTLSDNKISGIIPSEFGKLSNLEILDLSNNNINSPIPPQLEGCIKLRFMNLSKNKFDGIIPSQLGELKELQDLLDLSHNFFGGEIPSQLASLTYLISLNLSHNNLSGAIPSSFGSMLSLSSIDVSYNNLEGPVPRSKLFQNAPAEWFIHNKGLCSEVSNLSSCGPTTVSTHHSTKNHIILFVITPILGSLVLLGLSTIIIAVLRRRGKPTEKKETDVIIGKLFSILNFDGRVAYDYIINASENFDEKYCIGSGAYGKVYKVELPMKQVVAVKKLHAMEEGVFDEKSFQNEIQALTRIRHRNIVKLHGFCSSSGCRFLINEYIEKGSLASILRNQETAEELNWERRAHIIKDVTHALSYMHHDCNPSIVHRDISNNNILLDYDFKAYLSDFGTARILNSDLSNWSTVAGTLGYTAPELSYMTRVNEKCDVYSFGIVILEVIMGRHPGDLVSSLSSSDVQQMLFIDVLDQRIPPPAAYMVKEVLLLAIIAFSCIRIIPQARPTMQRISHLFISGNIPNIHEPLNSIKLCQLLECLT